MKVFEMISSPTVGMVDDRSSDAEHGPLGATHTALARQGFTYKEGTHHERVD